MPIYVVQHRLGKGGFGQVWLGERLINRRQLNPNKPHQARMRTPAPACTTHPPYSETSAFLRLLAATSL
jgi:hypothetical protein